MHIRPPSKVDACRHETREPHQAEEITNDIESQERRNRPVRSLGSMNDHECTDWNDQDPNDDRHDTETTMQVRSVRRHQTRLCEDQDEPRRQHNAVHIEIGWYRRDIELAPKKKRLGKANKEPRKQQA